jgi:rod shape-determining protein MreC
VRINKGTQDGVFKGQSVLDAFGIVGQVTRVDRSTSEIILISDNEHAIPVQVNRNGIRSIAVGVGDIHRLSLPFLTIESDVKVDDLLVSSGLDGIFPAGYPVAKISRVERNPAETFAVVEARPLAQLDRAREVLLLWFDQSAPSTQPLAASSAAAASVKPPAQKKPATPAAAANTPTPAVTAPKPTPKPAATSAVPPRTTTPVEAAAPAPIPASEQPPAPAGAAPDEPVSEPAQLGPPPQ